MSIWGQLDSFFMFILVGTVALDHPILISSWSVKLMSTQHVTYTRHETRVDLEREGLSFLS